MRPVRALVVLLIASALGVSSAQYDRMPYEDDPVAVSAAFGAEMAVLRLEAARALLAEDVDDDEVAEVLAGLELERMRFGAALAGADPDLFRRADAAFEAVVAAAEGEYDAASAVTDARTVAYEVRDAVSAPVLEDPAYAAAVMTLLLVSETGVAEGWEEAAEGEVGPYAIAWAGMPRLFELWEGLVHLADENQTFEIEDQLGELQALFENPIPPNMDGADPEEGEGAAVHVAGFLEDVTGAWLFPDRDLPALVERTRSVATDGCAAYEAGDERVGDAHMAWAAFAFGEYLAGTLALFAPEPTEEIEELLAPFMGEEEEGEEGEENGSASDGDAEDEDRDEFDAARSCGPLLEAFDEAGAALGL